jgi:hypothetical protein
MSDAVGYMYIDDAGRILNFESDGSFFAKNPHGFAGSRPIILRADDLVKRTEGKFLGKMQQLINELQGRLNAQKNRIESSMQLRNDIKDAVSGNKTVEEIDAIISRLSLFDNRDYEEIIKVRLLQARDKILKETQKDESSENIGE